MVHNVIYERPGEPRELAIWDKPITIDRKGDPFVFCLRENWGNSLSVEAIYTGSDVGEAMAEQSRQGQLEPNDVFVAHDSLVYTCCDVTLTKRREHRPELCAKAIDATSRARKELEREFAPPDFDWAQHDLVPAISEEKLEVGSDVRLHRNEYGDIVVTPLDQRYEPDFGRGGYGAVIARDSEDGQLLTTGRIIASTENHTDAELRAVEITNRIWLEQARAETLDRSR